MNDAFIAKAEFPALKERLTSEGFKVYVIDCSDVVDEDSYYRAVLQQGLPMGDAVLHPPLEDAWLFPSNWNSFDDFLYEGVIRSAVERFAVILTGVENLAASNPTLLANMARSIEFVGELVGTLSRRGFTDILLQCYLVKEKLPAEFLQHFGNPERSEALARLRQ